MTPTEIGSALPPTPPTPRPTGWYLPWIFLAVVGLYLASTFFRMNPPRQPYDLDGFSRLPAIEGGRVKPLDTVARVYLRMISHREEFYDEQNKKQPAIRWYLDVLATGAEKDGAAKKYQVFRIENDQLLAEMGLAPREGLRYSYNELTDRLPKLQARAAVVIKKQKAKKDLDLFETKLVELRRRMELFENLADFKGPLLMPPQMAGGEWSSLGDFREKAQREVFVELRGKWNLTPEKMGQLSKEQQAELMEVVERESQAKVNANPIAAAWEQMTTAYRKAKPEEFNRHLQEYRDAYLHEVPGKELARVKFEVLYDRFAPFLQCIVLYLFVSLLSTLGFILKGAEKPLWAAALRVSALRVLYLTLIVHTAALLVRMYVMDRPFVFVTNLYSSAIFIGWGCVVIGVALEWLYPIGIGNEIASVLGFATAIVAHNLATEDTLEMMQAVLDTNFWLSTHVTTVTLGYTATFVAGFLGAAYVFQLLAAVIRDSFLGRDLPTTGSLLAFGTAVVGVVAIPLLLASFVLTALAKFEYIHSSLPSLLVFLMAAAGGVYVLALLFLRATTENLDAHGIARPPEVPGIAKPIAGMALTPEVGKILGQMTYGVLCFATLLSFVGTVLGGIWADQSWGRFWGWDPKENGAVLIVLWNSLILHARWSGLVKARGVAVLAVFGNVITAWSWFGTNQLGIGLHAYGFDTRLADGCANFWLSQLVIIGLGLIPQRYWASATRRVVPIAANPSVDPTPVSSGSNGRYESNGHSTAKGSKGRRSGNRR